MALLAAYRSALALAGGVTIATLSPAAANADDYPSRPVKIIVPFGAGGPTDVYARAIGEELRKSLHQPFVMENRPAPAPPSAPRSSPSRRPMAIRC